METTRTLRRLFRAGACAALSVFSAGLSFAAQPFLAAPQSSGSLSVRLHPMENVGAGVPRLVTFGVPFTRDSLTVADLQTVKVKKNGVEIPVFVEQLTPWRHTTDAAVDGQSVRVARLQLNYTFAVTYPGFETITVEWGGANRSQSIATLVNPRSAWHQVTTGTFVAADNVFEPDVYAVLPKAHLAQGILAAPALPFDDGVAPTRDNPAVTDATQHYPGFVEYDMASKNFFYTIINENGSSTPYKTDGEPWLYDRSSAMFRLYLRSGFLKPLREAVRATEYYRIHINATGFFDKAAGDPKYAYNECLAYSHWLTGDNEASAKVTLVTNAFNNVTTRWSPGLNMWTERNTGFKLLANNIAYEVTGTATYKTRIQAIVDDFIYHQDGANGQIPSPRVDGGLYHVCAQHDKSECKRGTWVASPWMTPLIVDAVVRTYAVSEDPRIASFVMRIGNFEESACKWDPDSQYANECGGCSLRNPDYLMKIDGTSANYQSTTVQHAAEVGVTVAWAAYFAELLGTPDPNLTQLASELYTTFDYGVNRWTNASAVPSYINSPPRKYGWEYRPSGSFGWLMTP
jgi:hypothetical protein